MTPAQMAALHVTCFTTPRPWTHDGFTAQLSDPHVFALGRPTGFILGRVVVGEAELMTLAVDPAARRQGTGKMLVTAFLAEAIRRGAQSVFLEVAENNTPAQALYLACGFATTGRRRGYYHDPAGKAVDALIMTATTAKPITIISSIESHAAAVTTDSC